jgi:hypothetical protein
MVPRDGGNSFHGVVFGNYAPSSWSADNCGSAGIGQPCARKELSGDLTFNPNNKLTNVSVLRKIYDFNPSLGGPIMRNKLWFYTSYRYQGVEKTVADSFFDLDPSPFKYTPDPSRPGVDDGTIRSVTGRVTWQASAKDKISYYHDDQNKVRKHWGISSTIPPEASAVQATPTSFVSVSKWTRTHTNRLLFDAGLGIYNQEYQENYQASVFEGTPPLVTIFDSASGKFAAAWNNPADHFSKLYTEQFAANYVTGSHSIRVGATISQGQWRLVQDFTSDISRVTFNNGSPSSVTLNIPTDRRNRLNNDSGVFAQDKWTLRRATINAGVRWDWFKASAEPGTIPASSFNAPIEFKECSDGKNSLAQGCTGRVTNWKDVNPRIGISYDLFGTGKTAVKASVARYVAGIGLSTTGINVVDDNNPLNSVGLTDTRSWTDADKNGAPIDANGNVQLNELAASTNTNFGKNVPTTLVTDPDVLSGWGNRQYNWEYTISAQHEIMPRLSVSGGWYRRKFGNQTVTVDTRFSFAQNSYDGPFCVNAPSNPNLPNGGNYQVCGLYDLKPAVAANPGPASSLQTFSDKYGGETNIYEGFDVTFNARPRTGMFLQAGVNAQKRIYNQCNLVDYGVIARLTGATTTISEIFPNGQKACEQNLPYRPDFKLFGSYTLPFDILFSGTYQFVRGIQNGGAAPSLLATWAAPVTATTLGRPYANSATTRTFNLIAVGENYGNFNLNQLDLRASKRIRMGQMRLRIDGDIYNVFNSNWPFTASGTFSTSTTAATWMRPTNVLQARFFKFGVNFDF